MYYKIEPFGQPYIQSGIIASTIANIYRKKGARPFTFNDFLPQFKKIGVKQKTEEQHSILKTLAKAWGAVSGKEGRQKLKEQRKKRRLQKLKSKGKN